MSVKAIFEGSMKVKIFTDVDKSKMEAQINMFIQQSMTCPCHGIPMRYLSANFIAAQLQLA